MALLWMSVALRAVLVLGRPRCQRMNFRNWAQSRRALHILLALGQITLAVLFAIFADNYADSKADDWLYDLRAASERDRSLTVDQVGVDGSVQMSQAQRALIDAMLRQSLVHARHHLKLARYFFTRYYSAVATAMVTAFLAGISLLLVSRVGWANADAHLLNMLIVMSVLTMFFLTFPAVYRHKENIEANKSLYLNHVNVENELRTFLATGIDNESNGPIATAVYLRRMSQRLADLNQLTVGFDPGKLPSAENFRTLVKIR